MDNIFDEQIKQAHRIKAIVDFFILLKNVISSNNSLNDFLMLGGDEYIKRLELNIKEENIDISDTLAQLITELKELVSYFNQVTVSQNIPIINSMRVANLIIKDETFESKMGKSAMYVLGEYLPDIPMVVLVYDKSKEMSKEILEELGIDESFVESLYSIIDNGSEQIKKQK